MGHNTNTNTNTNANTNTNNEGGNFMSVKSIIKKISDVLDDIRDMENVEEYWYNQYLRETMKEFSLAEVEASLSDTVGQNAAANEFRSLQERGIETSTVDSERKLEKLHTKLDYLRVIWFWARSNGITYGNVYDRVIGMAEATKVAIKDLERSLDWKLGTDEVNELIGLDIAPVEVSDDFQSLYDPNKSDYNKAHWNGLEQYWTRRIAKLSTFINREKLSMKKVKALRDFYNKLWFYYRNGSDVTRIIKGQKVKVHVGGRMISNRHYAQARYLISNYLAEVATQPNNNFWLAKAERDMGNMEKVLGKLNKAGENVPVYHVDIDNVSDGDISDAFTRMTGHVGLSEDEMIFMIDSTNYKLEGLRRDFEAGLRRITKRRRPRITVEFEDPEFEDTTLKATIGDIIAS